MRSYSLSTTSFINRLDTIFKKTGQLSTLCGTEACVIHYGRDGELKIWPDNREKVKDLALRYIQTDEAARRKKSLDLYGFLQKIKNRTNLKKMAYTKVTASKTRETSLKNVNNLKYPIADHYSPDQVSQLTLSLELHVSKLQERLRLVEAKKEKKTKLTHQSSTPISLNHQNSTPISLNRQSSTTRISPNHHQHQTVSLNPSQFSVSNHGDANLSQIPRSASILNQDFSALLQESGLKNQLVQNELYGCDQNTCSVDNVNSIYFQHPCVSDTENYSGLLAVQESVNNHGLNQLMMQHELYGYDQDMRESDITSENVLGNCLSNTVSDEFCSDIHDLYGNMVVSTSCSQDLPALPPSFVANFDERSLLQTYTLSSLSTNPNSYDQNMCASECSSAFHDLYGNMVVHKSFSQELSSSYVDNFDESILLRTSTLPSLSTTPNSYILSDDSYFF